MEYFSIFVSSSISFRSVLQFLGYRSFTSLVRFILRYLMLLGALINGIDSLISLSSVSLLVCKNDIDFWALISYSATLPNCYMNSCNLRVESFGFSTQSIMSSAKRESVTSSLPICMPLMSFCCLIAEARTSSTMLNSRGESGHPCLVPYLR